MTSDPHDELAAPHFEDHLWSRLDELYRTRHDRPIASVSTGVRADRRRALLAVAAVAATLTIAAVAAGRGTSLVTSGEGISPPVAPGGTELATAVPGTTPGSAAAGTAVETDPLLTTTPDEVKARIIAALGPGTGPWIVHETRRETEVWIDQVTSARRYRSFDAGGRTKRDSGWPEPPGPDDLPYERLHPGVGMCDPATRLAMDASGALRPCDPGVQPPQPTHAERIVDHCRRTYSKTTGPLVRDTGLGYIAAFLGTGDISLDGSADVGGRRLIRLRNRAGTFVFLVDPDSYLPVRIDMGGSVTTYEHLPRTPQNLALLTPPVPPGFVEVPPPDPAVRPPACTG
jgi:hypothetical protein